MGMYDHIKCDYLLPVEGANSLVYQTKDTPRQFLDNYRIREDGTLWQEDYDTKDNSELGKWEAEHPNETPPPGIALDALRGCMTKVNTRWSRIEFTGEIRFYTTYQIDPSGKLVDSSTSDCRWLEWSSYFVRGELKELHLIKNQPIGEQTCQAE